MERNRLKRRLQEGHVGTIVAGFHTPDMVDFIGSLGHFDAVWIDMEHGPVTWSQLEDLSRAADLWGMSSIVRVRANDPELISLTLGLGVDGIIVPHVNTREEAEQVVDAALLAPLGHRGATAGRKSFGRSDYFAQANDETFIMVLIEELVAIENLPEMLQVPHIDAFYVTRGDLAQSMGLPTDNDGHVSTDARVLEVRDRAVEQIVASGRVAGAGMTEHDFERYIELGVRLTIVPFRNWIVADARSFADKLNAAESKLVTV